MSSDRSYLRHDYRTPATTMLVWIVSALVSAFVLQLVLGSPRFEFANATVEGLKLTMHSVRDGHLWTLVTHCLLHSTVDPFHILFTVIGLIFVGRELEAHIGGRRFLLLFFSSIIFSALCWCAVHWQTGGQHFGAGAAVFAFLVVLSEINAHTEMSVFWFPVSFRIRVIVWVLVGVELLGLIFYEIPRGYAPLMLSPSTHLGGMLAGWLYFRLLHARQGWDRASAFSWPSWLRLRRAASGSAPAGGTTAGRSGNLRADVDRILDKINSHGFGALTDEEKKILDEAKDLLSKR